MIPRRAMEPSANIDATRGQGTCLAGRRPARERRERSMNGGPQAASLIGAELPPGDGRHQGAAVVLDQSMRSSKRPALRYARRRIIASAFSGSQNVPLPFMRKLMTRRPALSTHPLPSGIFAALKDA